MLIDRNHRADIDIFHGDPQSELLRTIRDAMNHEGFRRVAGFGALESARAALNDNIPDLLVLDTKFGGSEVCSTVNELRHYDLGKNPFVPVIVTTWEPSRDLIHSLANCGADAVLVKPFAPKQLFDRIGTLANNRQPFVVTSDYVGPDRNNRSNLDSKLPLIEVPNTLRAKARGESLDLERLQQAIDATMAQVNEQKLSRHAYQISFLVGLILPAHNSDKLDDSVLGNINSLTFVAQDVKRRMSGTQYEHVSDLCQTLLDVVTRIQEDFPTPSAKDMKLLNPLSDAILAGFHPDNDAAAMAEEITDSIKTYEAKQTSGAHD